MAHVLVIADDPIAGRMMRDFLEDEGHAVTMALAEDEALAVLRSTLHPLVVVLHLTGLGDALDALEGRVLAAVRDAGDTWPAHRFVGFGWLLPPALEELAAAVGLRMAAQFRPDDLVAALDAAASEIRAA
jgi:CheY-like chemotaxis protein